MSDVELTWEEYEELEALLRRELRARALEISRTDSAEFKAQLRHLVDVMERVRRKIGQAAAEPEPATERKAA